ncbi:MAG: ATP-binding protein, partial [Pseudomonadota bacterium]
MAVTLADRSVSTVGPISDDEFACWIEALGPFEPNPHLAIALSGGADSGALASLTINWARTRGDVNLTALIVDHGLRSSSGHDAARVANYWRVRGVKTVVLVNPKPRTDTAVEEHARIARWSLLEQWCRENGVLHLLLGHHQDDQAETLLMR